MVGKRYHFNPETGETGECNAKIKCRFGEGTPHYETEKDARKGYEDYQAIISGWVSSLGREAAGKEEAPQNEDGSKTGDTQNQSSPAVSDDTALEDPESTPNTVEELNQKAFEEHDGPDTYTVPAGAVEDARRLIERANKRLEKAGISERFEILEEKPFTYTTTNENGFPEGHEYVQLKLNHPSISYAGYRFLAVVDKAENGLVVRGNEELNGWRPEKQVCDHCGKNTRRSKTYLVEDKEGNRLQVGSSCVAAYLGVKPEGLWAVGSNPLKKLNRNNSQYQKVGIPSEYAVAYALAVSGNGRHFVSKSMYDYGDYEYTTRDLVHNAIYSTNPKDGKWQDEVAEKAQEYIDSGRVADVIRQAREVEGNNDYCANMRSLASNEYIDEKHLGLMVSALAIDARNRRIAEEKKKKEEERKSWSTGFAAEVGENLKGRKMTVVRNDVDTRNGYRGPTVNSFVTLRDKEGHQVKWFASRVIKIKEGDEITLGSAKVKKHGKYDGVDQTVISNVRVPNEMSDDDWNTYYYGDD